MLLLHLHLYLGAVLQQRPCASSVPRALRSGVESSVGNLGLRDPGLHVHHQGNHPLWGREKSGLRKKKKVEKIYLLKRRLDICFVFLKKTVNYGNGTTIKMAVNEHFNFIPLSI